jgi:hypothetical protein
MLGPTLKTTAVFVSIITGIRITHYTQSNAVELRMIVAKLCLKWTDIYIHMNNSVNRLFFGKVKTEYLYFA